MFDERSTLESKDLDKLHRDNWLAKWFAHTFVPCYRSQRPADVAIPQDKQTSIDSSQGADLWDNILREALLHHYQRSNMEMEAHCKRASLGSTFCRDRGGVTKRGWGRLVRMSCTTKMLAREMFLPAPFSDPCILAFGI